jgi:hypothetical protein
VVILTSVEMLRGEPSAKARVYTGRFRASELSRMQNRVTGSWRSRILYA